ncbi:SFCGS family glycine-rich protein [Aeromonas veronii]
MTAIKLVIGDRLGKGQKWGRRGNRRCQRDHHPRHGRRHELGDVMNKEQADLGISFCGSGGAGAITAQTKYGYKCRYGMRSIEEGVTAINEGCVVLGFGFMDKEELGQKLIEAFAKKHGRA